MAAGKSSQSNTSLVALVVFIVLFLICAIVATIFYTKFEDQKALTISAEDTTAKLANRSEQGMLESKIVGRVKHGKSYIGAMSGYLDEMVMTIVGELPEANAATKVNDAKMVINDTINGLGEDATAEFGEEGFDLLHTIIDLKDKLEDARNEAASNAEKIERMAENSDRENRQFQLDKEQLIAAKNAAEVSEQSLNEEYQSLKDLMDKTNSEQIQSWADKLEDAQEKQKVQSVEMLRLTEKLEDTTSQRDQVLAKLESIKSSPENAVIAFEQDAIVFTSDQRNGLIYLNVGNKDHVYTGLTFSIFDRNAPIPEDGKGKAEIEVFRVDETSCVAKVLSSSKKNPVIKNDIAVNMIWNSKTSNTFMVMGEFDFDGDGFTDRNGTEKIKQMIKQWNGRITEELSINTDFLVVGEEPESMGEPTRQEIENDPQIEQEYEASALKTIKYHELLEKAKTLSVPVFNTKRFLRLIGYETTAAKSTPTK